ncbi:hypothetical protein EDEG_02835 [Edhazardia aedis USNM 41457]|uniref:Uncharacterized protein n=1 Tax=Edhazardia aedis (strain USNM 41457) TaxID=1003232 RepID=J9DN28_EDHAE|nr:hypothetical protein EDEG_02835 [Edhazardia aedis USNM 41457]|eukprot:EJW02772.1 hypothetical protein EDEG_02835 [Edhazardia aedis USNM 41457]
MKFGTNFFLFEVYMMLMVKCHRRKNIIEQPELTEYEKLLNNFKNMDFYIAIYTKEKYRDYNELKALHAYEAYCMCTQLVNDAKKLEGSLNETEQSIINEKTLKAKNILKILKESDQMNEVIESKTRQDQKNNQKSWKTSRMSKIFRNFMFCR